LIEFYKNIFFSQDFRTAPKARLDGKRFSGAKQGAARSAAHQMAGQKSESEILEPARAS